MDHQQECKICDKHVVKLAQHVRKVYDMNIDEYYDNMRESDKIENSEKSEMETEDASGSEDESASDKDESASDEDVSASDKDESTREESDSDEAKQTFFEFLLKNIENCEELTEQEIFQQLAKNTYWFLNAKRVAKNDAMLENIRNKTQKYVDLGLKYEDAMLVAFEKASSYFNNLIARISRISENEEE